MLSEPKRNLMHLMDRIGGKEAKSEAIRLCREEHIDVFWLGSLPEEDVALATSICEKVYAKYHTTNKFKIGDKVYVIPQEPTIFENCIRATVTEISKDRWGYHLRAFKKDLPGIYMFNIWDKDLLPRISAANKRLPSRTT